MLSRSPTDGATFSEVPRHGVVPEAEMPQHAAALAWRALHPGADPERIEVLTRKKKSGVYRLVGGGLDGSAVIGKRCVRAMACIEGLVYEDLLPQSEVSAPRWYGSVDEPGGHFSWIFVEDAGGVRYSPDRQADRRLAAEWLARLHRSVHPNGVTRRLPHRSPDHYRAHLRRTQRAIEANIESSALRVDHREVLHAVLSQFHRLDSNWRRIDAICERMPVTLTHGDLAVKNVRVRRDGDGTTLVPFDWETAGWGVPLADLAQLGISSRGSSLFLSLDVYSEAVAEVWPHVTLGDVQRWAQIGSVFRLLAIMSWEAWSLAFDCAGKAVGGYRVYLPAMVESLEALGLGDSG